MLPARDSGINGINGINGQKDRNKFWESLGTWTETANGECGRKLVAASEHYPLARMVGDPEVHWEEIREGF